ncbi:ABC transporter ATP-binding protein/permease [Candidatus Parcubacteria bacterium]|nr:ABC transporter ATP-binding protein/permease [Candidatus Parcubacteria bacterium]
MDKNSTKQTLRVYWQHAWKYKRYLIPLLITSPLATVGLRLLPPLIAAEIIRRLGAGEFIAGDFWASFGGNIVIYAIISILGGIVFTRLDLYLMWKLESYVNRDLGRTMFNHYMKLDSGFHESSFGGSLVSRVNKLIGSYIRFADTVLFQLIPTITSFFFIMIVMYPRSPAFVYSFVLLSTLYIAITYAFSKKVRKLSAIESDADHKTTGALADAVTNVLAIKSFASWKYEKKKFAGISENTRQRSLEVMHATLVRDFFASIITSSLQVAAVVVAVIAIVERNADLATVFLMLSYASLIADYLWQFSSQILRNFSRSMGDAQRAVKTLGRKPKIVDPDHPEKLKISKGNIEFKDVTFDHEELREKQEALFHNLNISIKQGEKVGLVGHSGGGKTTITKLLLRYMDTDDGEILIDSQNIAKISQDDLRKVITYVPQEPLLFHRSLAENIAYGKKNATHDEIVKASKMAHAHEFISKLPDRYETLVGERGVKLSGGQRQRVAIARAMLKDAPILLLDEATSALDSESEKLIQAALWKLMEGKTAIVIAHRLSTIQKMDRILVLENGEIVEAGSHKQLIKNKAIYAELWKHQSGGFLED